MKKKDIPEAVEPRKEETINILASKSRIIRQYINYLNQRDGLPMIQPGDHGDVQTAYVRLREYAVERGWVDK